MLVGILPELNKRYDVVLVTLRDLCDFSEEEVACTYRYNLGVNSKLSVVKGVFKLKNIIRHHKPLFIHAHLLYSSLIARLACPAKIPLIYTLHEVPSDGALSKSRILSFLEKTTFRDYYSIIAVSNEVMADYENTIKKVGKKFVLENYIGDVFIWQNVQPKQFGTIQKLRLVSVGNIREEKITAIC